MSAVILGPMVYYLVREGRYLKVDYALSGYFRPVALKGSATVYRLRSSAEGARALLDGDRLGIQIREEWESEKAGAERAEG